MLPKLITPIPGPKSHRLARILARHESPNVTFLGPPAPIFWKHAKGTNVWDVDGNRYLDLSSAFGVASLGHTSAPIGRAIRKQSTQLVHAMGDVHPSEQKAELLTALSRITFQRWTDGKQTGMTILCNSGFEAVEAALKTAVLATGRNRILGFEGGYHGLGYGALQVTWRNDFRRPFAGQLASISSFLPYPTRPEELEPLKKRLHSLMRSRPVGAVVVEPVQGRAGTVVPPTGFLPLLREACDRHGTLLIADEIFTGFWRTGSFFAVERTGIVPDIICLGKALTGALPLSACVGRKKVMQAWPVSSGEAIHTSTFLGNPLACAAALASIKSWSSGQWEQAAISGSRLLSSWLAQSLYGCPGVRGIRGIGMMFGIETRPGVSARVCQRLLKQGIIALPEGARDEVIGLTPALTLSKREVEFAARAIRLAFDGISRRTD